MPDQLFKNKLAQYRTPPSAGAWERLSEQLAVAEKQQKTQLKWKHGWIKVIAFSCLVVLVQDRPFLPTENSGPGQLVASTTVVNTKAATISESNTSETFTDATRKAKLLEVPLPEKTVTVNPPSANIKALPESAGVAQPLQKHEIQNWQKLAQGADRLKVGTIWIKPVKRYKTHVVIDLRDQNAPKPGPDAAPQGRPVSLRKLFQKIKEW